jgi:hypothetical protein
MPTTLGEVAPTASGAIAAALVSAGVGQGLESAARGENGHQSRGSFDSLDDLGLDGKDVQAQVRYLERLEGSGVLTCRLYVA